MTDQLDEARMSAAVKLQRAFEREQQKSAASRKRGEEVLNQAKKKQEEQKMQQANEGTIQPSGTDKIEVAGNEVPAKQTKGKTLKSFKFFTTNESYTFDTAAMAKQELADAKNRKHRKRGKVANLLRKLGMKEEAEQQEVEQQLQEVLSKDASAGQWIKDFIDSDNPKFAGKSKEKRKQMALAAYYAKQRNEEVEQIDELTKETEHSYFKKAYAQKNDPSTPKATKLKRRKGMDKVINRALRRSTLDTPGAEKDFKDQEAKRGIGHVRDHVELEGDAILERNQENATKRKMMDASRGARFKLNNPVPEAGPEHKTTQAHNKAIGRAIRNEETEMKPKSLREFIETLAEAKPVNVDKVNAAGEAPHEEKWEAAKKPAVKKESFTAEELLVALKEGLWPGTPEHTAKFGDKYAQKQGGGAGVKKGYRYGGGAQKPDAEDDNDADDKPAKKPKNK